MKVEAKEMGFYAGKRRRVGEQFVLQPGDKPGKWMTVIDAGKPARVPRAAKPDSPEPQGE